MAVIERLRSEQAFHDRQATERAAYFRKHPGRLLVSDEHYLDHEPWIRQRWRLWAKLGPARARISVVATAWRRWFWRNAERKYGF